MNTLPAIGGWTVTEAEAFAIFNEVGQLDLDVDSLYPRAIEGRVRSIQHEAYEGFEWDVACIRHPHDGGGLEGRLLHLRWNGVFTYGRWVDLMITSGGDWYVSWNSATGEPSNFLARCFTKALGEERYQELLSA